MDDILPPRPDERPPSAEEGAAFDAAMESNAPAADAESPAPAKPDDMPDNCDIGRFIAHVKAHVPAAQSYLGDSDIGERALMILRVNYPIGKWAKMTKVTQLKAWNDVINGSFFRNLTWTGTKAE